MTAEELAHALGNGSDRREGLEWRTLCPVHERDGGVHDPSLSIGERNGVVVWTCRVGCDKGAVTAAIRERGLLNGSDRPERRRENRRLENLGHEISRTKWVIRDIDGNPVAEHHRVDYEDDEGGHHKEYPWPGGLGGRPSSSLPFYGMERLKDLYDGARVIIAEGEKAADALRHAGFVALGTVTGAKKNSGVHCDDVLRDLTRFSVVLWPDNDDVGRTHMQRHGERLLSLGVKELAVVDWPDAPPSGDAADFERDDAAMLALIEAARPFEVAVVPVFGQLASEIPDVPLKWIIRGYIAWAILCELIGNPGDGKTYLAIAIAAGLTVGSFAGLPCTEGKVAFLSGEDSPEDLKRRLISAGAKLERVRILPSAFEGENGLTPVSLPDHIATIEEALCADRALVLFIDPITAFLNGKTDSHNDASSRNVLAELAALAQRTGTTICLIRHLNKMGSVDKALYRGGGSIAFTAAARTSFLIGLDPTDQAPEILRRRVIACVKSNLGPKPVSRSFVLRSDSDDEAAHVEWLEEPSLLSADDLLQEPHQPRKKQALEEAIQFLHDELDEGSKNASDITKHAEALGISQATLNRARLKVGVRKSKKGFAGGWVWSLENSEL